MRHAVYNPAFLDDDTLMDQFVVRQAELDALLGSLHRSADTATNEHVLLIAPRGFGKTTLVRRACVEMARDADLSRRWFPIIFAEESYEVATAGEFWLEALLHLADKTGDPRLQRAWEDLRHERDEERLSLGALSRMRSFADEQDKRLVLVVENLDMLLDEQVDHQQAWTLRKVLLADPRFLLIATAVQRFEGVDQPDHAMFDLFRLMTLDPLDATEVDAIWAKVAGAPLGRHRAAAIRVLTGGSPRLVLLLASFAQGRTLRNLLDDLMGLIDKHTDYFKDNLEALSGQDRRVFTALASLWEPSFAARIAEEARMDTNVVSAVCNRLVRQGRVQIVRTQGRSHVYQISERLYNIYYLMRRRGAMEGRVRALVDFMVSYYDPTDVPDVLGRVADEACGEGQHEGHVRLVSEVIQRSRKDPEVIAGIRAQIQEQFFALDMPREVEAAMKKQFRRPEVLVKLLKRKDGVRFVEEAIGVLRRARKFPPSEGQVALAVALADGHVVGEKGVEAVVRVLAWGGKSALAEEILNRSKLSELSQNECLLDLGYGSIWAHDQPLMRRVLTGLRSSTGLERTVSLLEAMLLMESEYTRGDGIAAFRSLLDTYGASNLVSMLLSDALLSTKEPMEALAILDIALASSPGDLALELRRLRALQALGDWETLMTQAGELRVHFPKDPRPHYFLASGLARTGRLGDARLHAQKALQLSPKNPHLMADVSGVLMLTGAFQDAVELLQNAICLAPDQGELWCQLALLSGEAFHERVRSIEPTELAMPARLAIAGSLVWTVKEHHLAEALRWLGDPSPDDVPATSVLAYILALQGKTTLALDHFLPLFLNPDTVSQNRDEVLRDAIRFAASGLGPQLLDALRDAPSAALLEPLIIALRLRAGEIVDAPQELREVAEDLSARIDTVAARGAPWRHDPLRLDSDQPPPEAPASPTPSTRFL